MSAVELFADWFRARRIAAGFSTQMELSIASTISIRTISTIESGNDVSSLEWGTRKILAEKLQISPEEFDWRWREAKMREPAERQKALRIPADLYDALDRASNGDIVKYLRAMVLGPKFDDRTGQSDLKIDDRRKKRG